LTVVYGARYDYFSPFTEAHNRISNFDYNSAVADPTHAASYLEVAGQNGVSATAGIKPDRSNFAPRVGFTAQIAPGTVLRGGFGMSYFPGNYTSNADLKNAPWVSVYGPNCNSTLAYNIQKGILSAAGRTADVNNLHADCGASADPTISGYAKFDQGLPAPTPQTIASSGLSFISVDPKLKMGIAKQYNLMVEKAFGPNVVTIGYVGVSGSHLPETLDDVNLPGPNNSAKPRVLSTVLPNLGSVGWYASQGVSGYNGLQTSLQRRLSKGLTASLNYTWAHALNDVTGLSEEGDQGWASGSTDVAHIRQVEYGNADNDIRHRFAGTATYALPFGNNMSGVSKLLLGGWQTNAILAWQSGHVITVENNSNRAQPAQAPHNDRPNMYAAGQGVAAGDGTVCQTAFGHDFCPQLLGTLGTEAKNQMFGPHFRHLDMSLFKDFPVKESVKVQFRAEVFNVSNTPSWMVANNNSGNETLQNGNFGKLTQADANYTPREIQFVLKVVF
jgi:hypothetical protein